MHEDMLSWPSIDVFYRSKIQQEGVAGVVYCTRVMAPFENVPAIAEHYNWDVIGMVLV